MQTMTNQLQERRKIALLLPVLVVPCLIFAFFRLGGGKGSAGSTATGLVRGVNMSLPMAQLDAKKTQDKLQLYDKAAADSLKRLEAQKQDPYVAGGFHGDSGRRRAGDSLRLIGLGGVAVGHGLMDTHGGAGPGWRGLSQGIDQRQRAVDETTDEVMARVAEVKKLINTPAGAGRSDLAPMGRSYPAEPGLGGRSAAAALQGLPVGSGSVRDPEMDRIDAMLDKLIRIQHPELVVRDTGLAKAAGPVLVLTVPRQENVVHGLGTEVGARAELAIRGTTAEVSGFMEIADADRTDTGRRVSDEALEATIDGDQTVMNGSWVALRLDRSASLGGMAVPAGQLLTGEASISGERLRVHIAAIRVGVSILPVNIQVYDLDGVVGIRVPGALTRDVTKESAGEAMSGLGLASMDPSLTGQAANAGLQLAKSLASRKVRAVRVALPAGYRIFLRNSKTGL